MDKSDRPGTDRAPSLAYGPDRRLSVAYAVGAAIFLALAIGTGDAPGRLLYALAAVVLAALVVGDLSARPRLVVDRTGLLVRTPLSTARLAWTDIEDVTVDERARHGLAARTLEIDAGARLLVLSGRSLGADPRAVAGVIAAFRTSERG